MFELWPCILFANWWWWFFSVLFPLKIFFSAIIVYFSVRFFGFFVVFFYVLFFFNCVVLGQVLYFFWESKNWVAFGIVVSPLLVQAEENFVGFWNLFFIRFVGIPVYFEYCILAMLAIVTLNNDISELEYDVLHF